MQQLAPARPADGDAGDEVGEDDDAEGDVDPLDDLAAPMSFSIDGPRGLRCAQPTIRLLQPCMATTMQQIAQNSGYSTPVKFQIHLPPLTRQHAQAATSRKIAASVAT